LDLRSCPSRWGSSWWRLWRRARRRFRRKDEIDFIADEIGGKVGKQVVLARRKSVLEPDILTLDVSQLAQPFAELLKEKRITWLGRQDTDPPHLLRLLGCGNKRRGKHD
jgi:hypothetical protein